MAAREDLKQRTNLGAQLPFTAESLMIVAGARPLARIAVGLLGRPNA
jgi:hypothetical protein